VRGVSECRRTRDDFSTVFFGRCVGVPLRETGGAPCGCFSENFRFQIYVCDLVLMSPVRVGVAISIDLCRVERLNSAADDDGTQGRRMVPAPPTGLPATSSVRKGIPHRTFDPHHIFRPIGLTSIIRTHIHTDIILSDTRRTQWPPSFTLAYPPLSRP
jgi:hypothetical protein